jgi:8-oxo-dGTP pyrophosphatase MutT (NUDIX family)
MSTNPWKKLATRPIYGTPWFSVRCDDVIRPDGRRGTYSVVHSERLAVGVLPLWDDGTITLVGQWRYPLDEYSWEIPEGGGDPTRDPIEAARAELREEAGLSAGLWTYLGRCHTSNCWTDEVGHLFLAQDLVQGTPEPGGDEEIALRRLPAREAIAMAQDGRITDAISIVGLFRLARHLDDMRRS